MSENEQRTPSFARSGDDASALDSVVRDLALLPLPPANFAISRKTNGIQVLCTGRDRNLERDGSIKYRIRWAENVDSSTQLGRDQGYVRSIILAPTLDAPGAPVVTSALFTDGSYTNGTFYCEGVDARGNVSEYIVSQQMTNEILDSSVPGNVAHLQISESGVNQNGTTLSELSVACKAPIPLGSFGGVQLFFKDYPSLGSEQEGFFQRYSGPAGGTIQFAAKYARGIRKGIGTLSVTNGSTAVTGTGSSFFTQAQAGDLIEVLGVSGTVQSVNSPTSITLTANWTGKTTASPIADWSVIALVTVRAVSISLGSTHRSDVQNAPSIALLFDGNDSAPNAPSFTLKGLGNAIRVDITPLIGTNIDHYNVYRGTGSGQAFSACALIHPIKHDPTNVAGSDQWVDENFTINQRELGQTFSYYVTSVNIRGQESSASSRVEASCRLDSGQDTDPAIPSRDGFRNVLFNGFIGGTGVTVGGTNLVVDDSDTTQNAFNSIYSTDGLSTIQDAQTQALIGTNTGLAATQRLRAWSKWKYEQVGGATVYPVHINGNEVKLPAPGAGKSVRINEWILAWNTATQKDKKIKKGGYYSLQVMVYTDATVGGSFKIGIAQYNGGASQWAYLRTRDSGDNIVESLANPFVIAGSSLGTISSAAPVKIYANFRLDPSFATDKIAVMFDHSDSTSGNIFIKEAMLNEGIEIGPWTGDMGNVDINYPTGTNNPGSQPDHDGKRDGKQV